MTSVKIAATLEEFVEGHFRSGAEQLAGAGLIEHLVVIAVPAAPMLRVYSGLAPGARAALMEQTADKLRAAAAELRKTPGQSVFAPNGVIL